jgi:hypothetical protein
VILAHGQWFSPGTPASSTTITGRHDIAEILLKVALKHQKPKTKPMINLHVFVFYCAISFRFRFLVSVFNFQVHM